jgi:BlaI family penicillinase repressor
MGSSSFNDGRCLRVATIKIGVRRKIAGMDLKQGDLENIILNALWDLENDGSDKIFVGDIQERIKSPNKKWAYTTVKTVLDRLVDKEIAVREKDGKKYLYRSVVDRDKAGMLALQKVVRQYFKNDVSELLSCLERMELPSSEGNSILQERKMAAKQLAETRKELASRN